MNIKFNHCQACGFPMLEPKDFGGNDENNLWCKNCCDIDGNHKSFEELVENMSYFLMSDEGMEISEMEFETIVDAKVYAINYLNKQPAFIDKIIM